MRNSRRNMNELVGQTIGYLTILKAGNPIYWINKKGIKAKQSTWECVCICGNTCKVSHSNLLYGRTKSCGCKRVELFLDSYEKYAKKYHPTPVERGLWEQYKVNASKGFNISFELFYKLVNSPCYYCGLDPFQIRWTLRKGKSKKLGGIDRLDSSIGYEPTNVVPCCIHCNRAKMDRTEADFKSWIALVYNNLYNSNDSAIQNF